MTNVTSVSKFGVVCNVLYAESVLTPFAPHKEEEEEGDDVDDDDNNNNNKQLKKATLGTTRIIREELM
jgi:hypothetical protein